MSTKGIAAFSRCILLLVFVFAPCFRFPRVPPPSGEYGPPRGAIPIPQSPAPKIPEAAAKKVSYCYRYKETEKLSPETQIFSKNKKAAQKAALKGGGPPVVF